MNKIFKKKDEEDIHEKNRRLLEIIEDVFGTKNDYEKVWWSIDLLLQKQVSVYLKNPIKYIADKLVEENPSYVLILKKKGKIDKDFNYFVNLLLEKLRKAEIINEGFVKDVLNRIDKFTTEIYAPEAQYTLFTLPVKLNIPKEKAFLFDTIKKEIQLLIKTTKKECELFNSIRYNLDEDEKIIPIDFDKILLKIYQEVSGLHIKTYKQDTLTKKMMETIINEGFKGIKWYVVFRFGYEFNGLTLDDEFFNKFFEKILNVRAYLKAQKLTYNLFDLNEIMERYLRAINDFKTSLLNNEKLIKELKNAGFSNSKIKIAIEEVEKRIPKTFIFVISCLPVELDKFKKIQKELIGKLNDKNLSLKYDVILTTNPYEGSNYGCFIQPRFDLAKLPKNS